MNFKKYKKGLKQKSYLLIGFSVLLTLFLTNALLNYTYSSIDEMHAKKSMIHLLEDMTNNFDELDEKKKWTLENLNLNLHVLDSPETLKEKVPSHVDVDKVLSEEDVRQLEKGEIVINKLKIPDLSFNILLFIQPVMEDGDIKQLLFIHLPINNQGEEKTYTLFTIFVALIAIGITIWVARKSFGKSYDQLNDIRLAALEVSKGNYNINIWNKSEDEIGEITEVFNLMTNSLKNEHTKVVEFVEDFTHEIKAPLALVKSYNQALMDQVVQGEENQQKCYRLIDRETDRLGKLIHNCLEIAKLGADSVELNMHPIVFAQSIEDIMHKYKLEFLKNNIDVNMNLDYETIISADEDMLENIIQNIIRNAIRYTEENAKIDITMEKNDEVCVLSIADNGVGISKEHLSIITNRFFRVNKIQSRKESGTGLGLSIVEKLMDLHGGKLRIESQLGIGTTVQLEFPLLKIEDWLESIENI